ncbi:MAG: SGNH/GDSL hydrolase family protein, partial [Candidatus Micrarchaeota archaeon]
MLRTAPALRIAAFSFFVGMNCAKPEPDTIREVSPAKSFPDIRTSIPDAASPPVVDASMTSPAYVSLALKNPKIVVLGDSILTGYGGLVAKALGENVSAPDGGLAAPKDVTKGAQAIRGWIGTQFDAHVSDPKNNIIVLEGGVNDLANLGKLGKKEAREDAFVDLLARLDGMVKKCIENNKVIILVTISPWKRSYYWTAEGQEYTEKINGWMKRQARPGVFVADTYSALVTQNPPCEKEKDTLESGYRGGDIQHPNAAGKRRIAEAIAESMGFSVAHTKPEASRWT